MEKIFIFMIYSLIILIILAPIITTGIVIKEIKNKKEDIKEGKKIKKRFEKIIKEKNKNI